MEERTENTGNRLIRIAITGPECTGKSALSIELARHFNTVCVPEYAREYISRLGRPYDYADVVHIAEIQRRQLHALYPEARRFVFFDTDLIITKIWFEVVYGQYPLWINRELETKAIQLHLLCDTSLPWVSDPVRENGGEMREKLYLRYKTELEHFGYPYAEITGSGQQRISMAINAVHNQLAGT